MEICRICPMSSTEFRKIPLKHRNSAEMGKFHGSAQNSVRRGKLWSLIITVIIIINVVVFANLQVIEWSPCSTSSQYNVCVLHIGLRATGADCPRPQTRAKPLFFGQTLNFSTRSHFEASSQKEKNISFVFIKWKKTEFILCSEAKCPKSGIFSNNYWVGWVGQSSFAS